jgi:uncharacterized protein (TIGR03905 family)
MIHYEIEGNTVKNVKFEGGCPGNAIGLSSLVEGMDIDKVIQKLKNIKCGSKATSCPDQLALALTAWKEQK